MCVPRAPILLHPASAFSRTRTMPGYPRLERGSWVRGWDSGLGFDHSSPERGKKITLNSIFCGVGKEALGWEREGKSC